MERVVLSQPNSSLHTDLPRSRDSMLRLRITMMWPAGETPRYALGQRTLIPRISAHRGRGLSDRGGARLVVSGGDIEVGEVVESSRTKACSGLSTRCALWQRTDACANQNNP